MARFEMTWILVADGARARVFTQQAPGRPVEELPDGCFVGTRQRSREIASDKPGRTFDSFGGGRHAKEPASDPHRYAELDFLRSVVNWLGEQHGNGAFDRLVLVAPPRALGDLRQLLPDVIAKKVVREVGRDLTQVRALEMGARLAELGALPVAATT